MSIAPEGLASGAIPVPLNTLWVGGRLTYVERVCLAAAAARGHIVNLYTYEGVDGVPAGVIVRDAREIMPDTQLVRHAQSKSWALGSDRFRLKLLHRRLGVWIDTDVYLLKPLTTTEADLFGWENDGVAINGAVLNIAPNSRLLRGMMRYTFSTIAIPPWWTAEERRKARADALSAGVPTAATLPWGSFGPAALTYFIRKYGLESKALPSDVFYPIHWREASYFYGPAPFIRSKVTERTVAIHLWNAKIGRFKREKPPAGSFMAEICRDHGVV
jgi:hypothetical protein